MKGEKKTLCYDGRSIKRNELYDDPGVMLNERDGFGEQSSGCARIQYGKSSRVQEI
jgi:hypothetical protein